MDQAILTATTGLVVATHLGVTAALVGAARRRPQLRRSWASLAGVILLLVSTAAVAIVPLPVFAAGWFLGFPLLCAVYPTGRRPAWPGTLLVAVSAIATTAYVISGAAITETPWWTPFAAAQTVAALALLVYRYARRLDADERMRLRWPLLGSLVEVSCFVVLAVVESGTVAGHGPLSVAAAHIAGLWIAPAFAVGLAWPRAANVDRLLRTVVAVILAAVPLGLLAAGALALGGGDRMAGWVAPVVVGVLAVPAWVVASRLSDRLVFRRRADPLTTLRVLGYRLDTGLDPAAIPDEIVGLVREALGLRSVVLKSVAPGVGDIIAVSATVDSAPTAAGHDSSAPITEFPIVYRGEPVAALQVTPRRGEVAIAAHDAAIIGELCRQAAPALHGGQVLAELVEAREHLEQLRRAERARLRRDLHDDLAPALAGLAMSAAAVAEHARDDDSTVASLADDMRSDAAAALARIRELVDDLRPEELEQRGLLSTLRARLVRDGARPAVHIAGPDGELHLDPRVEVAALRIVQEAVHNAQRHANATNIDVTLRLSAEALAMEVVDDGSGLDGTDEGVGLKSMRERAYELGGRTVIEPAPGGGTRVRTRLPLQPPETPASVAPRTHEGTGP